MNIPIDYQSYKNYKFGRFKVEAPECNETFTLNHLIESKIIIGETSFLYVTRFEEFTIGYWIRGKVVEHTSIVAIGINKSRLINWLSRQLELF